MRGGVARVEASFVTVVVQALGASGGSSRGRLLDTELTPMQQVCRVCATQVPASNLRLADALMLLQNLLEGINESFRAEYRVRRQVCTDLAIQRSGAVTC